MSVMATKTMLNNLVKRYDLNIDDALKLEILIVRAMGFKAIVSIFSLAVPSLYIVQDVYTMNFPCNLQELRNEGIDKVYNSLLSVEVR